MEPVLRRNDGKCEMSSKRVLVIEDEADILDMLLLRLKKEKFDTLGATNGATGLTQATEEKPDIVLLDLMLPVMNGLDVLRELRKSPKTVNLPVIIVSAKGDESDVVVGLELGADDYITKPFNMPILIARINALLRRHHASESPASLWEIGPITIDADRFTTVVDGEPVTLTRTEFGILYALATSGGRVLTRNQLIEQAIGEDALVTERTIDVHVTSLRGKLGTAREMIETVRGVGYRMLDSSK